MLPRILLFTFALLAAMFFPSDVFAQSEVNIIPPDVPPAGTDWMTLVGVGAGYAFAIVALLRQSVPKIDGWHVPLLVIPISVGIALYQVGYADLMLTGKHAGLIFITAYGGAAGVRKLGAWALAAYAAYRAGNTIPPPPDMSLESVSSAPPVSVPSKLPAPTKVPPLPLLLTLALASVGCMPGQGDQAVKTIAEAVPLVEDSMVQGYDMGLTMCEMIAQVPGVCANDPACLERVTALVGPYMPPKCENAVDAIFKPVAAVMQKVRIVWCSVAPTSEGCSQ